MDDILCVQINEAFQRLVKTEFAEALRVLTLKILEHGGESATIHKLHEDPKAILVVESLEAFHDRFVF